MDVLLKRLGVSQRGLYPGMTEEPLDLLQGHPALESQGSGCMPEDVRSDMRGDIAPADDLLDLILHRFDGQTIVRSTATDKERGGIVVPGIEIGPERNLSFGI